MKKLLIVEDEKMIRQGIKSIAMRAPIQIEEIIECKNGEEAFEVVKNQKIDVMITDIRMPGKDGITLVKEIQELPNVPKTVVISGYDDFHYAVELLRYGAREYLLKPIEREKIHEVLSRLEAELSEEKEAEKNRKSMWRQQLRYSILEKGLKIGEACRTAFEDVFGGEAYFLCCTNVWKEELEKEEKIVCLPRMQHQSAYIFPVSMREMAETVFQENYTGFSAEHSRFEELTPAFKEALRARWKGFYEGKLLVEYSSSEKEAEYPENFDREGTSAEATADTDAELNQYIQQFGTGKWEREDKFIGNLKRNIENKRISPEQFEYVTAYLMENIKSSYKNVIEILDTGVAGCQSIYQYDTVSGYLKELKEWMEGIHGRIISEFSDYKNKQKIQEALSYIQQNYNKDLNMAVVSNHMSMNYSLFSYTFKQYTGTHFVDYLKDLRMAKAKELLEGTEKKILEISKEVGYENEKHFMKTFKRNFGVSPSEYRKNFYLGKL